MEKLTEFKTRAEIANDFNISLKTLYRKIKEKGICLPRTEYLAPVEYEVIYKTFLVGADEKE